MTKELDRHEQEHTAPGAHRTVIPAFPKWAPADVLADAKKLGLKDAVLARSCRYRKHVRPLRSSDWPAGGDVLDLGDEHRRRAFAARDPLRPGNSPLVCRCKSACVC